MIFDYMGAKRKSGMSWADLEEATGVPASTLRDHMGGGVKSPDPDILDAARSAMDPQGAPQGPQGIPQGPQEIPQGVEMVPASTLAATRELYERQLAQLERALLKSERRSKRLAIALAVCVIFFTLLMAFDILSRDVGWFRGSLFFALGGVLP
nr:MAG TPA: ATP-dependent target DNA activator B [Caudoviricetes sp.]